MLVTLHMLYTLAKIHKERVWAFSLVTTGSGGGLTEFDLRCVEMGLGLAETCQTLDLIGKNLRWSLLIGLDVKQDKSSQGLL